MSKKGLNERIEISEQRSRLITADREFVRMCREARMSFGIPSESWIDNEKEIQAWKRRLNSNEIENKRWIRTLDSLRIYLHKPRHWNELLEQYLLTDFLAVPIYSFMPRFNIDIVNGIEELSFVQIDEPARSEDVTRLFDNFEISGDYIRKSVKKPRLIDSNELNICLRILDLTEKHGKNNLLIAGIINDEFNTNYVDFEIKDKRNKILKRIMRERIL